MKKKIVLFGTGRYFQNYMDWNDDKANVLFAVDNDPEKEGSELRGIKVELPEKLSELKTDSFYVVVCMKDWYPVKQQLAAMGIMDVQQHVFLEADEDMVELEKKALENGKNYQTGYVPGVFDLFHLGHLQLLRKSKARCEYLIAGVLTDELVEHFKGRRPIIPYAQRAAIVAAIACVDRVVPVDFHNTVKIEAWKQLRFDCHFSGNDHGADWEEDRRQLEEVGATMEFFQYSDSNSSTLIRKKLK